MLAHFASQRIEEVISRTRVEWEYMIGYAYNPRHEQGRHGGEDRP
jgi:hypothetical protein